MELTKRPEIRLNDEVQIKRLPDVWLRVTGFGEKCLVVRRKGCSQFVAYDNEVKSIKTHRHVKEPAK